MANFDKLENYILGLKTAEIIFLESENVQDFIKKLQHEITAREYELGECQGHTSDEFEKLMENQNAI